MGAPFTGTLILVLLTIYILVLFVVAWRADRKHVPAESPQRRAIVYSLSIAVYFSSWTYYGAVGTAERTGWQYLPIYLGPILAITVFFPLWRRIAVAAKRQNVGSIADFLSSRYGKSHALGTVAACVTIIGTTPYMALQLKSLSMAWVMVSGREEYSDLLVPAIAAILAGFAILFGARRPILTGHSRGLVRAVALESIVKLAALASVAILGAVFVWRSPHLDSWTNHLSPLASVPHIDLTFVNATLLSFAAILCLPRQFYVGFVELENIQDLKTVRWLFPTYLILTSLAVIPILAAGTSILQGNFKNPDMYVLELTLRLGGPVLSAFVFLGGFSAAAAMVTVETVALSAMVSNELVLPLIARTRWKVDPAMNIGNLIVNVRRGAIILILFLGWLYFRATNKSEALSEIGLTSFAAVAQLLPALIGGVLWRRGHVSGAIWGIWSGFAIWLYAIAGPQLLQHIPAPRWIAEGMLSTSYAHDLFVPSVLFSLGLNLALYVGLSLCARPRLIDSIQASAFIDSAVPGEDPQRDEELHGTVGDLKDLVSQFIGRKDAISAFEQLGREGGRRLRDSDRIDSFFAHAAERMLAGAIGAALARSVIGQQLVQAGQKPDDVLRVLDEAAQAVQFNRDLLHATLDNLSEGVSVVDSELRLVVWNTRYLEIFGYPPSQIFVGKPIAEVIRLNASLAGIGGEEMDHFVERRLAQIRRRRAHVHERQLKDGLILKIVGSPMPGGRYVTSFTDVTELRSAANALHQANEQLEERVDRRTHELKEANVALAAAKIVAERATKSQARFLAAASHDVLQPLQAARLFIGTVVEDGPEKDRVTHELLANADLAIDSADRLLRSLLNLSRLEVGGVKPEVRPVDVDALFHELRREFELVAAEKGLALRFVPTQACVLSDSGLLRSVLQNLVGNAIRYTRKGAVLVGCRRDPGGLRFEIRDSGPGIPQNALDVIFQEFSRLPHGIQTGPGAGLGLFIVERVCHLLDHKVIVNSSIGEGSTFAVVVPRAEAQIRPHARNTYHALPLGLRVLCVDNEPLVLQSIGALLTKWGAKVTSVASMEPALALRGEWDVILVDYKLEQDGNGLDLIEAMLDRAKMFALLTADPSQGVIERAAGLNVEIIRKPVAPLVLRKFLARAMFSMSLVN